MHRVVVIGASQGGVEALQQLAAALPVDFAAPVLIVLHIGAHRSLLPQILARVCPLPVSAARDGALLLPGQVYVAVPDTHMLVKDRHIALWRGAKEHHTRPAIDPLFRSAAASYGAGAIGVVLTGQLDDGTPGLRAIKDRGGTTIVQDPDEAPARSMPESALTYVEVDHCVPLDLMPPLLVTLTQGNHAVSANTPPTNFQDHEMALMLREGDALTHLQAIGKPSTFTCPDCHGDLWELFDSGPQRYRCHTGHAFTLKTLHAALVEGTDVALENALRVLQEKQLLLEHMAREAAAENLPDVETLQKRAARLKRQAALLASILEREADAGDGTLDPDLAA